MTNEHMKLDGLRILVVDDEMSLRDLLSEVLTEDGYDVTTAATAEEALQLFAEDPFPLVVTDIRMPGMSGIDLLKKIKQENEDTQVVIITSHASLDTAVTALREGAYDYLIKPFEELDVISAVVNRAFEKVRLVVENRVLVERLHINNKELEEVNSVLRDLAIRDGLTNLYNHRYLHESLVLEVARSKRYGREFSIIFFDVDNFKKYNDTHGHPKGDTVLKSIAQLLEKRLRTSDVAYRYGGEEFVLLLTETPRSGAAILAEDLRLQIEQYLIDGEESQPGGKLTVSIGVSTFPHSGDTPSALLQSADDALYCSKAKGRNCVTIAGE